LPGARRHLRTALRETEDAASRVDVLTQLAALEVLVGASGGVADLVAGEPAADPGMRDRLDVASLDALLPRPDRRAERVERLAALSARALADPVAVRAVLAHRAWAAAEQGDAPAGEAAALALEALAGDVLLRDASGRAAHLLAIRTLVLTDRHADAGAAIERLRDAAHSRGSRPLRAAAAWQAGELALRRGDLAGAEGHARVAIALADDGLDPIAGGALDVLVRTLSERGAFDQAQELLRARDVRTPEAALALRHAEARLRFAMGDHAGAARQAVEAGASAELDGPVNPALLPWRSTAAVALAHLGRRAEASELADAEIALAERFGAPLAVMVAMHAGAVAEPAGPAGVDRLRRALEVGEGTVAVLLTARIRLRLGHILSRSGARVRARDELRPALADADAAGAVPLAEHARRELVASGLRPRRAAIDGADALTPRQREVCTLAANGKGNREIARALFLSMKTVETHLAAGYRKLGIESRAQLAGVLGDAPLTLAAP
jgi:DNA-binding CsgD family transcriptional regulator